MTSSSRRPWLLLLSATFVPGLLAACGGDDGHSDSRPDGSPGPADAAGEEADAGLDAAPARCGQAIATLESNPSGGWLGVDADFVYWIVDDGTNGEVRRIDRGGEGPEVVLASPSPEIDLGDVILLDDSHVYLVADPVLTTGYRPIRRVSKEGGPLEPVVGAFDEFEQPVASMAMDETHVYWAESNLIQRFNKETGETGEFSNTRPVFGQDTAIALDDSSVYWEERGLLMRRAKSGDGEPEQVMDLTETGSVSHLIVEPDGYYYNAYRLGSGRVVVHVGSAGAPGNVVVSEDSAVLGDARDSPLLPFANFLKRDQHLYWAANGLWRAPASAAGPVERLTNKSPAGLAESTYLWYESTDEGSQIFEAPLAGCTD